MIDDDRNLIQPGDSVLLIVEDDITFARILVDLAHERGLKALVALRGSSALSLAREFKPGAITLDINLPDMAGWTILDRLKHDPATRHIPVHVISGDENRRRGLALGAMTYLEKSVTKDSLAEAFATIEHSAQKRVKKLLLVCADEARAGRHRPTLLAAPDIEIIGVGTGRRSAGGRQAAVSGRHRDPLRRSTDIAALQLVEEIQAQTGPHVPPIILFGDRATDAGRRSWICTRLTRASIVKTGAYRANGCWMNPCCCCIAPKPICDREQRRILEQLRADRCHAGRQEGAGGGRRCAQYLRAHQPAGRSQPEGGARRKWPRRHRAAAEDAGHRSGADGHHDAGNGRLRNHAEPSARCRDSGRCRSSR